MATIFSRIIQGEIPAHRIAENEEFFAFLDINPVQRGHTLIVPKREVDYYFDLSGEELARMQLFAQLVAKAIKQYTDCVKVGVSVIGLEVNHAHLHLIPLRENGDMDFTKKHDPSQEELALTAKGIRAYIDASIV